MGVTVILVAYHGDEWLPMCIESLAGASIRRLHLILVDNTGNTILDDLDLSSFDTEVIKTPHAMGFAEANNYALTHASHVEEAVLFLNQDTVSCSPWIDECLRCFAESEELGAVSPLIRTYDFSAWDPSFLACVGTEEVLYERRRVAEGHQSWFPVKNVPAPALCVRTEALRQAGPFDPVFGSYYEDYDLCRRIRRCGFEIGFCHAAEIGHYSGSTTDTRAKELRRMRQIIRNRLLYTLRDTSKPRLVGLVQHFVYTFPRNLARGLVRTASSQPPSVTLKAHWDVLRLVGRFASQRLDERAWERYLDDIGWKRLSETSVVQHAL